MNGEGYFFFLPERCRLVRGAVGSAVYDLDGGTVIPVPPSATPYLLPDADGFRVESAGPRSLDLFLQYVLSRGLGRFASAPPDETEVPVEKEGARLRDFAWLELTQACNLKCVHCYGSFGPNPRAGKKLTGSQWKDVLAQVRAAGFDRVQFIGGEPLMHRSLTELLFAAAAYSFPYIEVFSNLTLLDNKRLNALAAANAHLATTLYSVDPEVHDGVTGVKGSFAATVSGLNRAQQ